MAVGRAASDDYVEDDCDEGSDLLIAGLKRRRKREENYLHLEINLLSIK